MVVKISQQVTEDITGTEYAPGCIYNPQKDANDNWIISTIEADAGEIVGELIEYEPSIIDFHIT